MKFTLEIDVPDGGKWFPRKIMPENVARILEADLVYFLYDFMRRRIRVTVKKEVQSRDSH